MSKTLVWASSLVVVLTTLVAGSPSVRADEIRQPAEPHVTWYGWQTLLSDAGAISMWSLAAVLDDAKYTSGSAQSYEAWSTLLIASGVATYALGSPAIHYAHGNAPKAWGSLFLRLGAPVGGALFGALIGAATCGRSVGEVPCEYVPGVIGFVAGGVAAMVIDAAFIARGPAEPAGPRLQAAFLPKEGGGTLLLAGRF